MVLKYNLCTETSEIAYNFVKRHSWIYDYALYPYRNLWAKRWIFLIQSSRIGLLKKRWITLIFFPWIHDGFQKQPIAIWSKAFSRAFDRWCVYTLISDWFLVIVSFALIGPREHFCLPCFTTVEKYSYPYNLFLQTRGENAPWSLAIKHFTDIRESKGQWL